MISWIIWTTCMHLQNMSNSKKESDSAKVKKAEDEILLMDFIKASLCMRELNSSGRTFITNLQNERRDEISRLKDVPDSSSIGS